MNEHLRKLNPQSVLDIGANVGYWAKEAKEMWADAFIFMIEANPECEEMLKATGFPYLIKLISGEKKTLKFYQRKCGGTSTGDSVYRENTDWYNDENVLENEMEADTLDGLMPATFEFIKIDCQGAELDILRGGIRLASKAKWIQMEVPVTGVEPYNIGAPTREEVMSYMGEIGFVNHIILEDICHPIQRHIIQQDILFTR